MTGIWRTHAWFVTLDDGTVRSVYAETSEEAIQRIARLLVRHGESAKPVGAELSFPNSSSVTS